LSNIAFYNQNAESLSAQYSSVAFGQVHAAWKAFWPVEGQKVLDIGAGNGRDAKWFAEKGCDVIAVEPASALYEIGKSSTDSGVAWLNDKLPALHKVEELGMRFDLILVSAVWMHLSQKQRSRAMRKLSNLLEPGGKLVITLRHGQFTDGRTCTPVSIEELESQAKDQALMLRYKSELDADSLGRQSVAWQTVVLMLPDDGSGDLVKVRHIIVNDSKSSTYKLALLRTLLRIADAHPGSVLERAEGKVAIPLGLVALYWIRQYKRLIDGEDIQQNGNTTKGLAFIRQDGWEQIRHIGADDLAIGALFTGKDAIAVQKTIGHALEAIKTGPVKFTYNKDISSPYFEAERTRRIIQDSFLLDGESLASFGRFVLDESLWDCFRLYHSWIEPLVVNQWILEMRRFKRNEQRQIPLQTYFDCLAWIDKEHDTRDVRKRVEELRKQHTGIHSVWSGKSLKGEFHVDHCLPFAHWPNNDKWNLLPTTKTENLNKRDRLPTSYRLTASKQRILDWWQVAWGDQGLWQQKFFIEATMSLPSLPPQTSDFEEVFEAMGLQIRGVKSRLLIPEW
jgi:SAM-dependent methyltransferase